MICSASQFAELPNQRLLLEVRGGGQKAALVLIGLWLFAVQHRFGVPDNPST